MGSICTKNTSFRYPWDRYKVIYQHDCDFHSGLVDVLCERIDSRHIIRIIGLDPKNTDGYPLHWKNYGAISGLELLEVKRSFYYANYKVDKDVPLYAS